MVCFVLIFGVFHPRAYTGNLYTKIFIGPIENNINMESESEIQDFIDKYLDDDLKATLKDVLMQTEMILNIVSGVLMALAAIIYLIVPQTRDIEGKCTFHLMLIQTVFYMFSFYIQNEIGKKMVLEFCISHWYLNAVIELFFFIWCTILSYHMWRKFKQNFEQNESKLMRRYLMIGYGIPILLIILCNVHIHGYSFYVSRDFEYSYNTHRTTGIFYVEMPISIAQLVYMFFIVCLQRQLWNMSHANSIEFSTSSMNKFKFRLLLHTKLFNLVGLPWLLLTFCRILSVLRNSVILLYLMNCITFFVSLEGIIIFYILVLSRKLVYRGLASKFGIIVRSWELGPNFEESAESSSDNEDEFKKELEYI